MKKKLSRFGGRNPEKFNFENLVFYRKDGKKAFFLGIFVDLCDYSTNSPGWRSAATQGKFFLPSKSPSKVSLIDLMVIVWREVPMVSLSQESEVNTLPALVGGPGIYQSFFWHLEFLSSPPLQRPIRTL